MASLRNAIKIISNSTFSSGRECCLGHCLLFLPHVLLGRLKKRPQILNNCLTSFHLSIVAMQLRVRVASFSRTTGDSGCISVCARSPHWQWSVHPHTPSCWLTRYGLWDLQADANPLWNKGVSYKIYWCLKSDEDTASSLLPITLRIKSRGQICYCATWNQAVTPRLSKQSKNCFTFLRLSKAD